MNTSVVGSTSSITFFSVSRSLCIFLASPITIMYYYYYYNHHYL
jgi:hypothetical protein